MSLILNEKYINRNNSYKLFITNRFLRLYPVYWAILLLIIFKSLFVYIFSKGTNTEDFVIFFRYFKHLNIWSFSFLIFTNVFLFFQDIVMFLGLNTTNGNLFFASDLANTNLALHYFLFVPQAWTIGVELTFYLIAPFIIKRKFYVILILIFASLLLRYILYQNGFNHDPWTYRFFPTELVFFLLGNISYNIYKKIRNAEIKYWQSNIAFYTIIGFTLMYSKLEVIPFINYVYFVSFFISLPFVFLKTKQWKLDTLIGELSYPVYLSHFFVLTIINRIPKVNYALGLNLTIATILFSIILNKAIAKPMERLRQKRVKL